MESYPRCRSHHQPSIQYLLYLCDVPHPMVCSWCSVSYYYYNFFWKKVLQQYRKFFLSSSQNFNIQGPIYFNRTDVKKAINAPLDVEWVPCSPNVFNTSDGLDESLPPAFTVLPSVIEKNIRTVIVHGLADYILMSEGFVVLYLFYFIPPSCWILIYLILFPKYV